MKKAVYPGSFDPPTYGHLDIIARASALFDQLVVLVADNHVKKYTLPRARRVSLLAGLVSQKNVSVSECDTLIVDYMREHDITILVRGLRNANDFFAEYELARWNKILAPEVETVTLFPRQEYELLSSSAARELRAFGKDIARLVPPPVSAALDCAGGGQK